MILSDESSPSGLAAKLAALVRRACLAAYDCNGNDRLDACDNLGDCNSNGIPDVCDRDCDGNGTVDECEIAAPGNDCQPNTLLDSCEPDCNDNGTPDECDIRDATSSDCNTNGVPDECEDPIIYVNDDATGFNTGTSWRDAYGNLQNGLDSASANGGCSGTSEIWVAEGTYKPARRAGSGDNQSTRVFQIDRALKLFGGFAGTEFDRLLCENGSNDGTPCVDDSGCTGGGTDPVVVYSTSVGVPGAPWMGLHFSVVTLSGSVASGDGSFVRMTSVADGGVQIMDAIAAEHSGQSSVYFTGDDVIVELRGCYGRPWIGTMQPSGAENSFSGAGQ